MLRFLPTKRITTSNTGRHQHQRLVFCASELNVKSWWQKNLHQWQSKWSLRRHPLTTPVELESTKTNFQESNGVHTDNTHIFPTFRPASKTYFSCWETKPDMKSPLFKASGCKPGKNRKSVLTSNPARKCVLALLSPSLLTLP